MRCNPYFKRAAKRFLAGTRYKTPVEAVEAGVLTLEDWSLVLSEERDLELLSLEAKRDAVQHGRSRALARKISSLYG